MDSDGFSTKHEYGPLYCFLMANDTVVEMPLAIENFTAHITRHATDFIWRQTTAAPFYFLMSYFHVHTPLFTNRTNRGRSRGGDFGDNVEECDDSIGEVLQALEDANHSSRTLVMLTSDNGPYQEEGWSEAGRSNLYDAAGKLIGRLRGGKGQLFEGGVHAGRASFRLAPFPQRSSQRSTSSRRSSRRPAST
jgi:membrane-anchored protein YejM (alkaline phosphatase superfamily)